MNYNSMTYRELVHYLDLNSTDPVVRRLVVMLTDGPNGIIAGLEKAGMDPKTWLFDGGYDSMSPGEYIEELRHKVRDLNEDNDDLQTQIAWIEGERDKLKVRSVMELIEEVNKEKTRCSVIASEAIKESIKVKEENAKLREQIDMWGRLNKV